MYNVYYCRIPVDRDYKNMTKQNCSQLVTQCGGKPFDNLRDVTIGMHGEIVIVDSGNRCVIILDDKLNMLKVIEHDSNNSRLVNLGSVAVTGNAIAVSDCGSHQVKKYSLHGQPLSIIGCYGNVNGKFNCPSGLAFNNNNLLYVIDKHNYRVRVFQQDDTFAFSFGKRV